MPSETGTAEMTGAGALVLPGLAAPQVAAEIKPEHFIERGPQKRLMLFAGRSNPDLAERIGEHLHLDLGHVDLKTFADGETYCRYEESIRGADMFIVQTAAKPVDQHLMELLIMINAAKLASAKRITAVIPWFFYSRQDKKSRPREPITAKLVADMIQGAGADRVLTMDLHAGQVQGFFKIPVDHMTAVPMFSQYVRDLNLGADVAAVAPDTGRAKLAGKFAEMVGGDLVILNKERPGHNEANVTAVIGEVGGKVAVMTDDVIDTAGTICAGAHALKEAGATKVYGCATHALLNGPALERIQNSVFDKLVVTDTVPIDPLNKPDNLEVISVSGLLAETIFNVFADDSVSAIFAGENQLF
jgi:ribose-phosphate pyrophosphokinase